MKLPEIRDSSEIRGAEREPPREPAKPRLAPRELCLPRADRHADTVERGIHGAAEEDKAAPDAAADVEDSKHTIDRAGSAGSSLSRDQRVDEVDGLGKARDAVGPYRPPQGK